MPNPHHMNLEKLNISLEKTADFKVTLASSFLNFNEAPAEKYQS